MLTVLLTTSDGSRSLGEVLAAYERLVPPAGGWHLVVALDGCPAATCRLVREAATRLPLTVVSGPARGLNRARNAALGEVQGDLLVVTDDDAVPDRGWLVALRTAADAHPEADVFVGTVRPRFPSAPSTPIRALRWGPTFAAVERPTSGPAHPAEAVGPNFAVRVVALPAGRVFEESIGPDGSADCAMGAETELLLRLARAGSRGWYVREAAVEHVLPPNCLTDAWILARAVRFGRGRWRLRTTRRCGARARVAGLGLAHWADFVGRRVAWARARRRGDAARALRARWHLALLAGEALEARRTADGTPRALPALARALLPKDLRALVGSAPIPGRPVALGVSAAHGAAEGSA